MNTALEQDRRQKTDIGPRETRGKRQIYPALRGTPDDRPEKMDDNTVKAEPSDDAIIARVLDGDINAFELLARRYERWVCGIVSRRVAHDQVAEIAQEVFIHAYRSLPHYHINPSADGFRQWLATIAVRRCSDYQRAAYRHSTCAISNLSTEDREQMERTCHAAACATFHAETEQDAQREALREAMDGLDADDQIVLGLIYGQGYSQQAAADILGDSLGAVKARILRACKALRAQMKPAAPAEKTPALVNPIAPSGVADQTRVSEETLPMPAWRDGLTALQCNYA